jgi:hypothetical protein
MNAQSGYAPSYACHVYAAGEMLAVAGVNAGDPLGAAAEACLGDVYCLSEAASALRLEVIDRVSAAADTGRFLSQAAGLATAAEGSEAGQPGEALALEARLTFMAPDGSRAELLLIALSPGRRQARRLLLPLTPLEPGVDYTLIAASDAPGPVALADIVSVAFTRGTRITQADGAQCPIERLRPGDLVLTRDNGAQPVRHVLSRTVGAKGAFAPVAIPKGTLGNAEDLVVSQHQRLFLYQRGPHRIADRAELLVRARDLVDGETVTLRKGGYADYVSLVFDRHEVIYAECIPAESLLVNEATRRQLPEEDRARLQAELPDLSQAPVRAAEAPSAELAAARSRLLKTVKGH